MVCLHGRLHFNDNDIKQAVTVNGQRYHDMLDNFFIPQVEAMYVADIHFQQDRATCHTTRDNITLLMANFQVNRFQSLAMLNGLHRSFAAEGNEGSFI